MMTIIESERQASDLLVFDETNYRSTRNYFFTAAMDDHPRVRLEAVRALAELGTLDAVSQIATVGIPDGSFS